MSNLPKGYRFFKLQQQLERGGQSEETFSEAFGNRAERHRPFYAIAQTHNPTGASTT